ncbi:MAG: DinB family protein [Alphaproteobacteria bacterium]
MFAEYFRTLAAYNRWANEVIYAAVAALPAGEFEQPRAAFFGSIKGTLNHILVGDRSWRARIEAAAPPAYTLDQILYEDFPGLRAARTDEDARIVDLCAGLTEDRIAGDLSYRNFAGKPFTSPLSEVLGHLFNHQTHHRGQVHDMISRAGGEPPALDLIYFTRLGG